MLQAEYLEETPIEYFNKRCVHACLVVRVRVCGRVHACVCAVALPRACVCMRSHRVNNVRLMPLRMPSPRMPSSLHHACLHHFTTHAFITSPRMPSSLHHACLHHFTAHAFEWRRNPRGSRIW
jgi:hypothetical protein